jgi:hypothetical protein
VTDFPQDFADRDLGLKFSWPKHHNLHHAVELLKQKGPTNNYETGLGESLHPQVKTDYERSSGQPETVDIQVTFYCRVTLPFTDMGCIDD